MPLFVPVQLFDRDLGQLPWAGEKIKIKENLELVRVKKVYSKHS